MIKLCGCRESDWGMHHERRCGDLVKILWHDGIGLSLYAKRLDKGRFIWPSAKGEPVAISAAQMSYMLEGVDWANDLKRHAADLGRLGARSPFVSRRQS